VVRYRVTFEDTARLREKGLMAQYVFLIGWCLGTSACLVNGIFALLSPTGWLRARWTTPRMRGLEAHPNRVRLLGGIFTLAGVYWAILACQSILRFLPGDVTP
jgi:hypothetical protein